MLVALGSDTGNTTALCVASVTLTLFVIVTACLIQREADHRRENQREFSAGSPVSEREFVETYRSKSSFRALVILLIAVVLVMVALYSLALGTVDVTMSDVLEVIKTHIAGGTFEPGTQEYKNDMVIWNLRMPRVIVAIVAGAGLAIGGAVMQAVVKNPLADPYTTGISAGAVLGASLFIVLGFSITGPGSYGVIANAFLFSLIPAALMVMVSKISNGSPATIILLGTAVSYIFGAVNTLVMTLGSDTAMQEAFIWSVGSLSGVTWDSVPVMTAITAVFSVVLYLTAGKLNLMMSGDNTAKSLGLNVDNYRMVCLLIISLITASIVSYLGMIGFVGLIVPHIIRMLIGSDSKLVIPASMLGGATAVLLADILARMVSSAALPVGVVLSFVGGPLFLLLVIKSNREAWNDGL